MAQNVAEIIIRAKDEATSSIKGIISGGLSMLLSPAGLATAAMAALGMGIKTAIDEAKAGQIGLSQLETVIASTGGAAGVTSEAAIKLADDLSTMTGIEGDAAIAAENMLLTFTNIGKDAFPGATMAVADMATAMNGGAIPSLEQMQQTSIQVGKALNDPIDGVTALKRVGVTFTEAQREQIKVLQESGDIYGAQKIVLSELQKEFGGSAKAAGETFAGQMAIANEKVMNSAQSIGDKLLPLIGDLIGIGADLTVAIAKMFDSRPVHGLIVAVQLLLNDLNTGFKMALDGMVFYFEKSAVSVKNTFNWFKLWGDDWKAYKLKSDADMATKTAEFEQKKYEYRSEYDKKEREILNNWHNENKTVNQHITKTVKESHDSQLQSSKKLTKDQISEIKKVQKAKYDAEIENTKLDSTRKEKAEELKNKLIQLQSDYVDEQAKLEEEQEEIAIKLADKEEEENKIIIDAKRENLKSQKKDYEDFIDDKKGLITILADFEGEKEKRITTWVKDEIEKRVIEYAIETSKRIAEEVFAQTKIQEIRTAGSVASAATTTAGTAGSVASAATTTAGTAGSVASGGIVEGIVSGAGSIFSGAVNTANALVSGAVNVATGIVSTAGNVAATAGNVVSAGASSLLLPAVAVATFLKLTDDFFGENEYDRSLRENEERAAQTRKNQEEYQRKIEQDSLKQAEKQAAWESSTQYSEYMRNRNAYQTGTDQERRQIEALSIARDYQQLAQGGWTQDEMASKRKLESDLKTYGYDAEKLQVNVVIDKQILGRAVIDLQRQQNAGVL